jgi:methylmalonyl-CoA mutase N-terminal domain/subunit
LALRTQQVLAEESGTNRTVDPLGGSYYVESLTDQIEEEARAYLTRIEELGGASKAIEYMQDQIHRSAYRHQREIESGERTVVGVNTYAEEGDRPRIVQPDYTALEQSQRGALAERKGRRDAAEVRSALADLRAAAYGEENLMPSIIRAVAGEVTLGEISDTLRDAWGTYDRS